MSSIVLTICGRAGSVPTSKMKSFHRAKPIAVLEAYRAASAQSTAAVVLK
jgi:hypothetical protein